MRIRKRFRNLVTRPDLSSPPPVPSTGAAPVAVSVEAAGKEGEAIEATGGKLFGPRGGGGAGGGLAGGGRGLHLNGDLPAEPFHGCTTKPISFLHFHPPPPEAAAAEEGGGGDLPAKGLLLLSTDVPYALAHRGKMPTRVQDGDQNGGDRDAHRRWNTNAHGGGAAAASKSLGAQVQEPSLGHSGCIKTLSNVMPKEEDTARWSDEERGFPLKTRRGCYRAQGVRAGGEKEEEDVGVKKDMKPRRRNTRRRRTAASTTTAMAPTGIAPTSSGSVSDRGAQTASGAGVRAARRDDIVVKEEGADVTLADGNRGGGNGKKRRSPSVLMEGSRCSRVNGRGWRCCQQTLVGYSLCEHHLGKGRLRSVSSVRCNGRAKKKEEVDEKAPSQLPSPLQKTQQKQLLFSGDGENEEEENLGKGRRRKIGTVKARSISSLLHQPDYSAPTVMAAPEPSPSSYSAPATGIIAVAAAPLHDNGSVGA